MKFSELYDSYEPRESGHEFEDNGKKNDSHA
jgi:hypothetical protein